MRRMGLVAVALLGTSGAALAGSTDCVQGFGSPIYSGDQITYLFDFFSATSSDYATCSLSTTATISDPDVFAAYTADYRGFILDGERQKLTVEHDGRTEVVSTNGPQDGTDPYFTHLIGKDKNGNLVEDVRLDLTVATDPNSEAVIDSIDYNLYATMTRHDAEDSIDQIGLAQAGLVTHLDETAGLLTGGNLALEGGNEFGTIGAIGSYTFGTNFRYNLADGFSVLAGVSIIDMGAGGADASGVLGAAAIRYVQPDASGFRLFGEGGVHGAALALSFSRSYEDSNTTHTVSGDGDGLLGAGYLRGGVLIEPDANNQIVLSASVKQSVLGISNYAEEVSADNPFAADLSGTQASFTTVKAGADWTTTLAADVDLTASGAIGSTMGNTGTEAYIFGGGDVVGTPQSALFAEYGLRVGWTPTSDARIDGFVAGSTGVGIGTHAQVGAAYHMSF